MKEFYLHKKILVTGHTGFKGSWLTQILLNWGADVVGVSLHPTTTPNLFGALNLEKRVKNYFLDINDLEEMKKIVSHEKPEIIFHLAAQPIVRTGYDDPIGTFSTNCMGTANILEAIREVRSVRSAVIITTDKVYENKEWHYPYRENDPLGGYDPYSASKAAADIVTSSYIQSFFNPENFEVTHTTLIGIARAGNVVGGGDWADYRLIPDVIRAVYHDGKHVEIRNPASVRPWQHVLEPLSGYLLLAKRLYEKEKQLSQAWNFGPYNDSFVSVESLLLEAKKAIPSFEFVVKPDTSLKHEAGLLKLDINKASHYLNWKPRLTFEQTVSLTFDWYKNYYEKKEDVLEFTNKQINDFFR
jgi:CDP-glucose 4,6-dehydratase